MEKAKTKEPQYQKMIEDREENGLETLGFDPAQGIEIINGRSPDHRPSLNHWPCLNGSLGTLWKPGHCL